jgi:hypothetical protein
LVKASGETYYAISSEFDVTKANEWLQANIIAHLENYITRKPLSQIGIEIVNFIGYQKAEFWAFFGTFDWFLVMDLYGGFEYLPYNFPMYCGELKQEIERLNFPENLFPVQVNQHQALSDAKWNKALHEKLIDFEKK